MPRRGSIPIDRALRDPYRPVYFGNVLGIPFPVILTLIVVLIGLGFATMMIGMVVLLPLVGHATWHAYKDLVE